jgi:hypothetical protein
MKPILFNTAMVKVILDGQKTQTRRIMKPQPEGNTHLTKSEIGMPRIVNDEMGMMWTYNKLKYNPGDILWVRETWACNQSPFPAERDCYNYIYKADYCKDVICPTKWRPSIHMPREAARLFLKVTNVRAERLWDITEEDARAEGVKDPYDYQPPVYYEQPQMRGLEINKSAFAGLWDSINKRQDGWDANPWVWAIEFEKVTL